MRNRKIFVALLAILFSCVGLQRVSAVVKQSLNIYVDGKIRNMIVYTPTSMSENLPLMIVTHGMNQNPEFQLDNDKLYTLVDSEKFVLAYLRSVGSTWDIGGNSDMNFVIQTIGEMYSRYKIDAHRVYWSGFSMGSMLIYHCMSKMQGKIAAFAPTSGVQFSEQPWQACKRPVNIIHCHAYEDAVFVYDQYDIRNYVTKMAGVNGTNTYKKVTDYKTVDNNIGDREEWKNDKGNTVVLYSYKYGAHAPSSKNKHEIWNFVKQFSLSDDQLDPIPTPEAEPNYQIDASSEVNIGADKLNGRTFLATDPDMQSIFYMDSSAESPQNVNVGAVGMIGANPYCWFKFTKASNVDSSISGNLYNIQMADKSGANYTLWGSNGYLNTPPGAWCLFALGIKEQNGEDAKNCGLWKVDYEEGKGYTIQNVGVAESDGNSWLNMTQGTPQAEKAYIRLFSKVVNVQTTGIENVSVNRSSDNSVYNLNGQRLSAPVKGQINIINGKKVMVK